LKVLLTLKGSELSNSEIETVFNEVQVSQIPTSVLIEYLNRECETSFNSIDEIPEEFLQSIINGGTQ
jgi:hypothetical protein